MDRDVLILIVCLATIPLSMLIMMIIQHIVEWLWKRSMAKARAAEAENPDPDDSELGPPSEGRYAATGE